MEKLTADLEYAKRLKKRLKSIISDPILGKIQCITNAVYLELSMLELQQKGQGTSTKEASKRLAKEKKGQQAVAPPTSIAISEDFGDLCPSMLKSKSGINEWTAVAALTKELNSQRVLLKAKVLRSRRVSKKLAFMVVTDNGSNATVQWVATGSDLPTVDPVVKYISELTCNSVVDIEGIVVTPAEQIRSTTQQVEVQWKRLFCVSRAEPPPFSIQDASRTESCFEKFVKEDNQLPKKSKKKHLVRVNQDTRLKQRVLDLQTPANNAIFKIMSEVAGILLVHLRSLGFIQIFPPQLNDAGSSKGSAAVFGLNYFGKTAVLAQSPQLHKQMAIRAGFQRVFVIQEAFRAEASNTHQHLCEFTGLNTEMEIDEHYSEVMDLVEDVFINIFDSLNKHCKKKLETVRSQYPFSPLKYLPKQETPRLTFEQGVQMLKDDGMDIDPMSDLSSEAERKLGQLVLERWNTEFFMMDRFPLIVRPFYTMPDENSQYSHSFDVYMRGKEILTGGERITQLQLVEQRAQ